MKKTAFVTGSSRGIGREIALKLAEENYTVVVTGRSKDDVEKTTAEIKSLNGEALSLVADLTTEAGLKEALAFVTKNVGKLDVLVTNIGSGKTLQDVIVDVNEWKRVFDINFFSAVAAINTFLPLLEKSKGQVVCISSIAGIEKISVAISYSVAKAAVISLVQQMMRPLAAMGVRINAVSPGNVWIENGSWDKKMKDNPARVNDIIQNQVALQKFVSADEIADAVWFTVKNSSITGQNIVIDAGQTRQWP
ncbi:MAG: short-chain dehydrogenase/reductase [Pseudobdellovibrio sp.]|nr:short-chain dehydrogenase/reductase [Pseudobdellovibrio sp.]